MFIHVYEDVLRRGHLAAFQASTSKVADIRQWCYNTYGEPSILCGPDARWYDGIQFGEILLKNERDLTLFLLKWSGE